jgi:transposase
VALVRLRDDPATRVYAARRRAEGKSPREIRRCVKRAIARHLFKLLQRWTASTLRSSGSVSWHGAAGCNLAAR